MEDHPTLDVEALLVHDRWLRSLARALVGDSARSDDVAQEAWVEALERPPGRRENVRGWLARVVRSRARTALRSEARRAEVESLAPPRAETEAAGAAVERASLQRDVADAVLGLPEPYRTVLLLRCFEGLPPRAIAHRIGAPVATVRTRYQRALALLRRRLEGRLGERGRWLAALAAIATGREGAGTAAFALGSGTAKAAAAAVAVVVIVVGARAVRIPLGGAPDPGGNTVATLRPADREEEARESPFEDARTESTAWRELAAAGAGPARGAESIRVRVVRASDGAPIPHARLRIAPADGADVDELLARPDRLEEELVWGEVPRADGEGARIAPPASAAVLVGEADGLFGALAVAAEAEGPLVLELVPDADVDVRVVHGDGRAARGVEVALRPRRFGAGVLAQATTAADGRASLRHVLAAAAGGPREATLSTGAVLRHPVVHTLDLDELPSAPVELVLPATGELELVLEGPPEEDASVAVAVDPGVGRVGTETLQGRVRRRPLAGGRALVRHVEVGAPVSAQAFLKGGAISERVDVAALLRQGERRTVRLPRLPIPVLVGRLVDARGEPLPDAPLAPRLTVRRGRWSLSGPRGAPRTDESGRFRVPLPDATGDEPGELRLELESHRNGAPASAVVELALPLAPGELDLGDVALEPLPVLASGRVVDDAGAPLGGAEVEAAPLDPSTGAVRFEWVADAPTDEDGRFEIRRRTETPRVRLAASHAAAAPGAPADVAAGARGVVLRLAREAIATGRLELESDVPTDGMQLELRPAGARAAGEERTDGAVTFGNAAFAVGSRGRVARDGSFRIGGVEPGVYDLVLHADGEAFDVLAHVTLFAGENDLGAVPVRRRSKAIRLTLVDEAGFPVTAKIHHRPAGEDVAWTRRGGVAHRATIVTSADALEVWAHADGRIAAHAERVDGDLELRLPEAERVRIELDGAVPPLPEEGELMVELALPPEAGAYGTAIASSATFGPDGSAELAVPAHGDLDVRLVLVRRNGWTTYRRFGCARGGRIRVEKGGGGSTFEVEPDLDALAALLAGD